MINKKLQKAFNQQINAETYSAYLYLSMAANLESMGLDGFANWMKCQAQEEMSHAMKFYTHILDRGGEVELLAIEKPQTKWDSVMDIFKAAYKHEQKVSSMINDLVDLAAAEKDHAAGPMLQWFVEEQIEEEKSADEIVNKLKLVKETSGGILMLDKEMAQRAFTPSTVNEGE
jgi:ferritin